MTVPLTDEELAQWARRHLVYEVRMLVASAVELSKHKTPNPQSNAFLESFLIHARCLRDLLWGTARSAIPTTRSRQTSVSQANGRTTAAKSRLPSLRSGDARGWAESLHT